MRSLFAKLSWLALAAAVGLLLFGCSDNGGGSLPLVTSQYAVTITPASVNAVAGAVVPMTATVTLRSDGSVVPNAVVTWGVTGNVGTISESGVFTATMASPQSGTITATAFDATASIPVVVNSASLAAIQVTAPAGVDLSHIPAGSTVPFTAVGLDADGNPVAISPLWSVQGNIGQLDQQGHFLAQTPGNGTIVASVGELQGTKDVTVVSGPPVSLTLVATGNADLSALCLGQRVKFTAYLVDGAGNRGRAARSLVQAAWSVTGDIGCIDPEGNFIATGLGSGTVVAQAQGLQASLPVSVTRAFAGAIAFTRKNLTSNLAKLTGDGAICDLTTGNNHFGEAAWAPTVDTLAFVAADTPQQGICFINGDGSGFQPIYGGDVHDPAWSPDGLKLVCTTSIGGAGQLVLITKDGTTPQKTSACDLGIPRNPAWSPDGGQIAFCINSGHAPADGVYLMNADTPDTFTRIYAGHPADIAWMPGSNTLAVADGNKVYLIAEGCEPQPLLLDANPITALAWAPNGCALVCSVQKGAYAQLVLKVPGTEVSLPLTAFGNASALDPTWK